VPWIQDIPCSKVMRLSIFLKVFRVTFLHLMENTVPQSNTEGLTTTLVEMFTSYTVEKRLMRIAILYWAGRA